MYKYVEKITHTFLHNRCGPENLYENPCGSIVPLFFYLYNKKSSGKFNGDIEWHLYYDKKREKKRDSLKEQENVREYTENPSELWIRP